MNESKAQSQKFLQDVACEYVTNLIEKKRQPDFRHTVEELNAVIGLIKANKLLFMAIKPGSPSYSSSSVICLVQLIKVVGYLHPRLLRVANELFCDGDYVQPTPSDKEPSIENPSEETSSAQRFHTLTCNYNGALEKNAKLEKANQDLMKIVAADYIYRLIDQTHRFQDQVNIDRGLILRDVRTMVFRDVFKFRLAKLEPNLYCQQTGLCMVQAVEINGVLSVAELRVVNELFCVENL